MSGSEVKADEVGEKRCCSRLEHFPISFFAIIMGLGGFCIATMKLEHVLGLGGGVSTPFVCVVLGLFALIFLLYLCKVFRYWGAVKGEWSHPVKISFFPAFSISLIILSICFMNISPSFSEFLWWIGAPTNIFVTLMVVSTWINHSRYEVIHMSPAWFIPAVGNILIPVSGVEFASADLNWFFFSTGIVFWVILLTIVLYRLIFHNPLPDRLAPTMFILIAPPAVGFLAYMRLEGELDPFARILYFAGVLFFLLMLVQVRKLLKIKFFLTYWAYSFPMAAFTISTLQYGHVAGSSFITGAGIGLFVLLVLLITGLVVRTVLAIARGEICRPEQE